MLNKVGADLARGAQARWLKNFFSSKISSTARDVIDNWFIQQNFQSCYSLISNFEQGISDPNFKIENGF